MVCSQCQTGRAWDAQGRCRPCSIGNVNLGPPGTTPPPRPRLAAMPSEEATAPPRLPARPRPKPCSQCCIGEAWDAQGRCRPCSTAGVQLAPPTEDEPADDAGDGAGQAADEGPEGSSRGWLSRLRRRRAPDGAPE